MLILDSQHGFRKGRSCLSNLLVFLDKVNGSIDSGEAVDVIFMDFAKAFDIVPHIRLGRKLESHGIRGLRVNYLHGFWIGYLVDSKGFVLMELRLIGNWY